MLFRSILGFGLGITVGEIQLGIDTGFFKKIWKGMGKGMAKLGKWFMRAIFVPIKNLFNNIVNFISDKIINPMVGLFSNVLNSIGNFININIIQPLQNFWKILTEGATKGWETTLNLVTNVGIWVNDKVMKPIGTFFTNIFNTITTAISTAWEKTTAFIKDISSFVTKTIISPIKNIFNKVKEKINLFVKGSFNFVTDLFTNIKNAIFGFFNKIFGFIKFIGSNSIFNLIGMATAGTFGKKLASFNKAEEFQRNAMEKNTPAYNEVMSLAREMKREKPSLTITEAFTKALNQSVKEISDKVKPVTVSQINTSDAFDTRNIDKHLR